MVIPLLHFAKRFLNCEVSVKLTPNLHEIFIQRPDCLILSNSVGAFLHYDAARIAHRAGIPVFALSSEGNFPTDGKFNYWGYNKTGLLYENYYCCWSVRTMTYLRKQLPEYSDRIVLTGAVGFDRYRIYEFASRAEFLKRHKIEPLQFSRYIAYAGWGFGNLSHTEGRKTLLHYFKEDSSKLDWAEDQRITLREILRKSIEAHPETLFILKKHPTETVAGQGDPDHNEMAALKHYPNVLYLLDENLHDLISVVDLWWVYESTTAIESSMIGRQTLFIVPDENFPRSGIHRGFPQAKTFEEVDAMSERFFTTGSLPEYHSEAMSARRKNIIIDTIGYIDGYNHIRAAYYLKETLEAPAPAKTGGISIYYFIAYWVIRALNPLYRKSLFSKLPWLKKKCWIFDRYHLRGFAPLQARYQAYLDKFYDDEKIAECFHDGTLFPETLGQPKSEK